MPGVDPDDVTALLDRHTPAVEQAVALVTAMAKAYTRGRGFNPSVDGDDEPNDDIAAVITIAAARFAANSRQLPVRDKVDDVEEEFHGGFNGWTLAEQAVLNRYRVRAM